LEQDNLQCFITKDFNHPQPTTTISSTNLQIEHIMAHQNRLANTHVLILGGTSGIGFAVANLALSSGARVTISGSKQPKVDDKVEKLRSFYPNMPASNVAGYACDLLDKESMEANLQALLENVTEGGSKKINHIAITAGDLGALPKVEDVTIESALGGLTTRFLAPALLIKIADRRVLYHADGRDKHEQATAGMELWRILGRRARGLRTRSCGRYDAAASEFGDSRRDSDGDDAGLSGQGWGGGREKVEEWG
jgi:NAD(P)-dependent dehydrogenase (short-subunit alcohol dehydrogenase family)